MNLSIQVFRQSPVLRGDTRKALRQATAFWGGIPEDVDIPLVPISPWTWVSRVLPRLTRLGIQLARLRKEIPQFIAENRTGVRDESAHPED